MAPDERADEVDVMDHEIQHDGDVRPARIEGSEPIALDESRRVDERERSPDRAIEPLHVSGLNQRASPLRNRHQLIGLGERGRDRFLDHHVDTALERGLGDLVMPDRWHDHRDRFDLLEQRLERGHRGHAELAAHLLSPFGTDLTEADEASALDVAKQAHVMLSETSRADHTDAHGGAQITTPRWLLSTNPRKCFTSGVMDSSDCARSSACDTLSSERKKSR